MLQDSLDGPEPKKFKRCCTVVPIQKYWPGGRTYTHLTVHKRPTHTPHHWVHSVLSHRLTPRTCVYCSHTHARTCTTLYTHLSLGHTLSHTWVHTQLLRWTPALPGKSLQRHTPPFAVIGFLLLDHQLLEARSYDLFHPAWVASSTAPALGSCTVSSPFDFVKVWFIQEVMLLTKPCVAGGHGKNWDQNLEHLASVWTLLVTSPDELTLTPEPELTRFPWPWKGPCQQS